MKRTLIGFLIGWVAIIPHVVLLHNAHPGDDLGPPCMILMVGGPWLGILGAVIGFLTGRLGRKWMVGIWAVVVFFYVGFLIQNWEAVGRHRDEMRRYEDEMRRNPGDDDDYKEEE